MSQFEWEILEMLKVEHLTSDFMCWWRSHKTIKRSRTSERAQICYQIIETHSSLSVLLWIVKWNYASLQHFSNWVYSLRSKYNCRCFVLEAERTTTEYLFIQTGGRTLTETEWLDASEMCALCCSPRCCKESGAAAFLTMVTHCCYAAERRPDPE